MEEKYSPCLDGREVVNDLVCRPSLDTQEFNKLFTLLREQEDNRTQGTTKTI